MGPEHILLGIMDEGAGEASQVLAGLSLGEAREEVRKLAASDLGGRSKPSSTQSAALNEVLKLALTASYRRGGSHVEPEDLLLGILHDDRNNAVKVLFALRADPRGIEKKLMHLLEEQRRSPSASQEVWGFEVPGGFVTTELRGGVDLLASLVRNAAGPSIRGAEQDIVVKEAPNGPELYREGPYNNVTVNRPLRAIRQEIEELGLERFLKQRQVENAQVGPVSAPSGRSTFPTMGALKAWVGTLGHRRRRT